MRSADATDYPLGPDAVGKLTYTRDGNVWALVARRGVPNLELISDFIHAADRVAMGVIWRGAGHGPDLNMELTGVYTVRKGRILGIEFFWDHAEAPEAVGLSE